MASRQEVVVVDGLPETAEVLRAVFEPRGITVSRQPTEQNCPPDLSGVLVLHESPSSVDGAPRVIVGRIGHGSADESGCLSLPQPFHYADLIAAITQLADRRAA